MKYLNRRRNRIILYIIIALILIVFFPSIIIKIYINSSGFKERLGLQINERLKSERLNIVYELGEIGIFSGIEFKCIRLTEKERQIAEAEDCSLTGLFNRLIFQKNDFSIKCNNASFDLNYLQNLKTSQRNFKGNTERKKYNILFDIQKFSLTYKKIGAVFHLSGKYSNNERYLEIELRDRYRLRVSDIDISNQTAKISFKDIDIPFVLKNYLGRYDDIIEGKLDGSTVINRSNNEIRFDFSDIAVKNMILRHKLIGERPFKISKFLLYGKGSISLASGLLRLEDMKIDLSNMIFGISGRFYKGSYSFNFKTERLYLNDLARFFDGEEMDGFDMSGEIRIRISASGNINQERKIDDISISGEVYKPEQKSRRLNYLKSDFVYDFIDRNDKKIKVYVGAKNPDFVSYGVLPTYVYGAVVSSEDAGFFGHKGVEFKEIESAIIDNIEKGKPYLRGGSTITQQLVKNLFLTKEKTLLRKMKEMLLAIELDAALSKERMLEIYLNGIEWGPNIFGIGQAARHYFGKTATELRPVEAAYLASIIPNPNRYYVYYLNNDIKDVWYEKIQNILYKMNLFGFLSDEEYNKSLSEKVVFDRAEPWKK